MIPVVNFDPSSLCIWFDPHLIYKSKNYVKLHNILEATLWGDFERMEKLFSSFPFENEAEFSRIINLVSCVWHEQKHFCDFLLTNYGSFRIRQFFELYINIGTYLEDARKIDNELLFPTDIYASKIRSNIHKANNSEVRSTLAHAIKKRKSASKLDREKFKINGHLYEFGGEAQIEALAYITQHYAILKKFGFKSFEVFASNIPQWNKFNRKYTWFVQLGQWFGLLKPMKLSEEVAHADVSNLLPIIYASLINRNWVSKEEGGDLPINRFINLASEISKNIDDYDSFNFDDKWGYINHLCKTKWGRTVEEELLEDYAREEALLEKIRNIEKVNKDILNSFEQLHKTRNEVINIFIESPIEIIDPEIYIDKWLPKILPTPVIAFKDGNTKVVKNQEIFRILSYKIEKNEKFENLKKNNEKINKILISELGYNSDSDDVSWYWAGAYKKWEEENQNKITIEGLDQWFDIVSYYAPLSKLMINGRKHRHILGPEIFVIENILSNLNFHSRFDPLFEFPEEGNAIDQYYYLTGLKETHCDICYVNIKQPQGHYISPWVFRYSINNGIAGIKFFGGNEFSRLKFIKDWSPWIICESCYSKIRKTFDWKS